MAKAQATEPEGPSLETYKRMLSEALSTTETARRQSQTDDDYYNGIQWTPEERRELEARKQPDNVFNRIRITVNGTLGVIRQGNTDPRAYPRNPGDADAADVASKTLRFIADQNRFDEKKLRGAKDYLVQGTCAAIVEVGDENEIIVSRIRFEEFFYDPRSREEDFSDAAYMGCAKWINADDLAALYPDRKAEIEATIGGADPVAIPDTMQDRPADISWVDSRQRRLMLVEMYHREAGVWHRCVFYSGGLLAKEVSAYKDDRGRPLNPIEAQSCYVDRENNRMGVVRDMRGPQDEINKRRSKGLHLLNTRQVQESAPGALAGEDPDNIRKEAARPDGVLPSGAQIVPTMDMFSGQMALLAEAKDEIERLGPNPAMLGRQAASSSGRAQMVRQQAGLTELAIIFGGIEDWELRLYRQMWNRARQYWTAPKWVRITDDDNVSEFIGLNQPKGAPVIDPATGQPAIGPDGQPIMGPPVMNPDGSPALGVENEIAKLDVDIILDSVPDTASLQQEQFEMMVDLAKFNALGPNPGPLLLEASSLPNKRQVIEKLEGAQGDPAAQQARQLQEQIGQRGAAAKIAETEASAALKGAQAQETQLDSALKAEAAFGPQMGQQPF